MRARRANVLAKRLLVLNLGLMLMGLATALMLAARLGVSPWAVFHEGLGLSLGISHGRAAQVVGLVILTAATLWLRQRPGVGTVLNMLLVGVWIDLFRTQPWLLAPESLSARALQLVAAVVLYGFATALYLAADLGAGPRDGLMLGAARSLRAPIGTVRSTMEVAALAGGWALGGPVGVGTVLFAVSVGPLIQWFLRVLRDQRRGSKAHDVAPRTTASPPTPAGEP